ncbi:hypothetical protein Q5424_20415 [Conexibacter sp. JD483]|uniref:hypothetical protein n=1 Tax=unclassified Conexibacter TaxID=2627773 RepID=UPI00271CEB48|nr:MULTISPECIES: hypothetical protein [unclassified Conexibacter]MDO8186981.1 hypothetical protein [Conexibacter sp. CPCC 205706]MDO8200701.1 hypothetical protein [Conexibacter sp. CPCC 205762]MDR9371474.1 hypothetical protein [Conexibacter sp. JD483]
MGGRTALGPIATLALLLGVLVVAQPAAAHRVPTREELEELAGATGPPSDPACVRGLISTVDVRWGAVFATHARGCPEIDRTWVLQRDTPGTPGNRWRELRQGIRFGVCSRDLPGIPDKVGLDLGVCAPPSRRVYVPAGSTLAFKPARLRYSRSATIENVRWSRWNGARASGRGTFVYRDPYGPALRAQVIVTLFAIDLCGSDRTYLGAQLAPARPQDASAIGAYRGRWYRQCPAVTGN